MLRSFYRICFILVTGALVSTVCGCDNPPTERPVPIKIPANNVGYSSYKGDKSVYISTDFNVMLKTPQDGNNQATFASKATPICSMNRSRLLPLLSGGKLTDFSPTEWHTYIATQSVGDILIADSESPKQIIVRRNKKNYRMDSAIMATILKDRQRCIDNMPAVKIE